MDAVPRPGLRVNGIIMLTVACRLATGADSIVTAYELLAQDQRILVRVNSTREQRLHPKRGSEHMTQCEKEDPLQLAHPTSIQHFFRTKASTQLQNFE